MLLIAFENLSIWNVQFCRMPFATQGSVRIPPVPNE